MTDSMHFTTHHVEIAGMPTAGIRGMLPEGCRGMRLAVHTSGSGLPLLLLHGFPLDHRMWRRQAPLAEHLRLIVPDQRGFGGSDGPGPAGIAQLADDAVALLDALHVARPAVVCGLSMGGYVAQHVAARHPERVAALVLVDTRLDADTPEARTARDDLAEKVGRIGQRIVSEAMVPRLLAASTGSDTDRSEVERELREMIQAQSIPTIQAALRALGNRPDMTEAMRQVAVPTLLVVGAEDAITPPACLELAEAIMPEARLLVVPRAGHMVPMEAADVFNRAVLEFLAEAVDSSPA
jgi:3-oxoadipate enol-lactonase